jgi:predicted GIY-YIG superfamily endonuclease
VVPGEAQRAKTGWTKSALTVIALNLLGSRGAAARSLTGEAWCPAKPNGRRRASAMWYVYILRSIEFPDQEYTGATEDPKQRLSDHNAGRSPHTAKFKPWKLIWYCAFPDKYKAIEFEKYLKSHSGRAFAKKRLS